MTISLRGLEDSSEKFRHWHANKTYGGNWSGTQLCSYPTTTLNYSTDNNDDNF